MRFDSRGLVSTYLSNWMPTGDVTYQRNGYTFRGTSSSGLVSDIEKLSLPSEVKSTLVATLTFGTAGNYPSGFSNSGVAGYATGGNQSSFFKITYSTDAKTTVSGATLTNSTYDTTSFANSGVAGYTSGGQNPAPPYNFYDNIDKLTFSTEVKSTLSPTLTSARYQHAGMANSGTAGYFGGGNDAGGKLDAIDKIVFSADTKSTLSAVLTAQTNLFSAMADSGVAGYFCGGDDTNKTDRIDKITFPADTKSTLSATLSAARSGTTAYADTGVAGYVVGGLEAARVTTMNRISFPATEARTTLSAVLSTAQNQQGSFSDCGVF